MFRLVTCISPGQHICQRIVLEGLVERSSPPVCLRYALITGLGNRQHLATFLPNLLHYVKRIHKFRDKGFGRAVLVAVNSDHIHHIIPRPSLHIDFLSHASSTRGIGPDEIAQASLIDHIVKCHLPQGLVLIHAAEVTSPPEPASRMLVPRAKDNGNHLSIRSFK